MVKGDKYCHSLVSGGPGNVSALCGKESATWVTMHRPNVTCPQCRNLMPDEKKVPNGSS